MLCIINHISEVGKHSLVSPIRYDQMNCHGWLSKAMY